MNPSPRTSRRGSLLLGTLALAAWPLAIVADTCWAVRSGWSPAAAGQFRLLTHLAVAAIAVIALALVVPPLRRAVARHARGLLLAALGLGLGVATAQWLLIPLAAPRAAFHMRPAQAAYEFAPNPYATPGIFGEAQYTTNALGIRGGELPADPNVYRILCLGGSTTEGVYLDDSETWPALLMDELHQTTEQRYWVGAAGISDYASGHHLRFVRESPVVDQVDCLLVMMGVNDLLRVIHQRDAGHGRPPAWYRSHLLDLAWEVWNVHLGHGTVLDHTGRDVHDMRIGREIPPRDIEPELATSIDRYGETIRELVAAARARGVRLVFVSQPVLWDEYLTTVGTRRLCLARLNPYPREWELLQPGPMRDAMDRYNDRLESVCRELGVELIDAALELDGQDRLFYDDYHLNEEGCRELAQIVGQWIAAQPLKRESGE